MYREQIQKRIEEIGSHPAWGLAHCQRVYELALELGGNKVDEVVIYAAAMTHDFGAYPEYRVEGVDHVVRSVEVIREFLPEINFPKEKLDKVVETVAGHMFYNTPNQDVLEALVFHDADVLEFMGYVGVARILSLVGIDNWARTMPEAVALIEKFSSELPEKIYTEQARPLANQREAEMKAFLDGLRQQTDDLRIL